MCGRPGAKAAELIGQLQGFIDDGLTERETSDLKRVMAAFIAASNAEHLTGQGITVRSFDSRGPGVERENGGWFLNRGGWADHVYALQHPGTKGKTYVSEPYEVDNDGIRTLARLIDEGWDVHLTGRDGMHFPGWTFCIFLERRDR